MGKTSQVLTIWVDERWRDHPKIKELREKGHVVCDLLFHEPDAPHQDADPPDLILAGAAHQWHDGMWDHLDTALKSARARKYPTKKGKKDDAKTGK